MLLKFYYRNGDVMGYLDRYLDCKFIDHFPNDTDTLEATFYKADLDGLTGVVCPECVIETKDDITVTNRFPAPESVGIRYVVKEITYHDDKTVTLFCKFDLGSLETEKLVSFNPDAEDLTLTQFSNYILNEHASGWSAELSEDSPPDTTMSAVLQMETCCPLDVIKAGASVYGYEYYLNQKTRKVVFGANLSSNTVIMSTLDLNLRKLEATEDSLEYYNEVEAYGKDGLTVGDWGSVDSEGRRYYSNYGYSTTPKRLVIRDDKYANVNSLRQFVLNKLAEVSAPKRSYKVDLIDIGRIIAESDLPPLNVGDIVKIEKPERNPNLPFIELRISEMTRYPDRPESNTCTLSSVLRKTEDYLKQSFSTATTVSRISSTVQKISDDSLDFAVKNVNVTMSASTVVSGGAGLSIRKWGKIVTITGSVIMDHTGNDQVIASFATNAAPSQATFISCNTGGNNAQSTCYVTANGTVGVNAYSTQTLRIHGMWIIS